MQLPLGGGMDPASVASALRRYMSVVSLSAGQLLWRVDDPANDVFLIEKGAVRVRVAAAMFWWEFPCWPCMKLLSPGSCYTTMAAPLPACPLQLTGG